MKKRARPSDSRPPFDPNRVAGDASEPTLFGPAGPDSSATVHRGPAGDDATAPPTGPRILTVTALTRLVKSAINKSIPGAVHVVGEISNLSSPSGGHVYFTLKDDASEVRCVMWRSDAATMRFEPKDGLEVLARGEVDVYEPRGQYQLYVRRMEPKGVGALELAFQQLRERLEKEGLFDPRRKKALPLLPRRIAVVTSPTGAAINDILQTLARRFPCVEVLMYPVKVQGEGAAAEVAEAIRRLNRSRAALGGIDVMIVGRGGGSMEDLWAFNEEVVARAIFASEIPVVSAVGHEVDFTIADFVADVRAATPTAAAEIVVLRLVDLLAEIDARGMQLGRAVFRRLETAQARLALVERSEWFRDPLGRIAHRQQQVDEAAGRLRLTASRALSARRASLHDLEVRLARGRPETQLFHRRERLSGIEGRLHRAYSGVVLAQERRLHAIVARREASSPRRMAAAGAGMLGQLGIRLARAVATDLERRIRSLASAEARLVACSHEQVMRRGFTLTRRMDDGRLITSASQVSAGTRVTTRTADGDFLSDVV